MTSLLGKPQFLFRPSQIWRRLLQRTRATSVHNESIEAVLPWGLPLRFRPSEHIGDFIYHHGVYDLCVTEAVWRLMEPGEDCLDVGGNIGYMSCLMACRAGRDGTVHAFEPHPEVFRELAVNAAQWEKYRVARVVLHQTALSDREGCGQIVDAEGFESNRGTGFVGETEDAPSGVAHEITLRRLDDLFPAPMRFGVMKIDIEGHEEAALRGASALLSEGRIRDVVFEDHNAMPSPVARLLEEHGFTVFHLRQRLVSPVVTPIAEAARGQLDGPPNYVATRETGRAIERLGRSGWAVLRRHL